MNEAHELGLHLLRGTAADVRTRCSRLPPFPHDAAHHRRLSGLLVVQLADVLRAIYRLLLSRVGEFLELSCQVHCFLDVVFERLFLLWADTAKLLLSMLILRFALEWFEDWFEFLQELHVYRIISGELALVVRRLDAIKVDVAHDPHLRRMVDVPDLLVDLDEPAAPVHVEAALL